MQLTSAHRSDIVKGYCIFFYVLMLHKIWNGFTLYQLKPAIFNTRYDVFTWIFMKTGIHQWLLNNPTGWLIFDCVFYGMPAIYWLLHQKNIKWASYSAIAMLIVNWIYIQCYTLYPANSMESFTPWLLFPFLLMTVNLKNFYWVFQGLRYFFLFFFASSGVWKVVQGSIFNLDQMSGVLLFQHKEYLMDANNFYSRIVFWLIAHRQIAFSLFISATFLELFFFIGFFTKKYDRLLIAIFVLFLISDVLVMRIPYWEVTPFLITLWYSKYKKPENSL